MHLFCADRFHGELIECDEGDLCWVPKTELKNLPLWAGDYLFLDLLDDPDTPFFSMKLVYEGEALVQAMLNGKNMKF